MGSLTSVPVSWKCSTMDARAQFSRLPARASWWQPGISQGGVLPSWKQQMLQREASLSPPPHPPCKATAKPLPQVFSSSDKAPGRRNEKRRRVPEAKCEGHKAPPSPPGLVGAGTRTPVQPQIPEPSLPALLSRPPGSCPQGRSGISLTAF